MMLTGHDERDGKETSCRQSPHLSSTNVPCEHGFCPLSLVLPRQGHTVFLHCISETHLWRNLIWKCLMTHSYPAAPTFGSRMQKLLTGGDPSAFAGHCKWYLQGSGLGTGPLTVFCNDCRMKLNVQRADCYRTDTLLRRQTC